MSFLAIFIPAILIVILIIFSYQRLILEGYENKLLVKEEANLELVKGAAGRLFRSVITDLLVLSENQSLMEVLRNKKKLSTRARAAQEFVIFSRRKASYDQIRYIDEAGKEIIRVDFEDGDPRIVPSTSLQDKSNRYYFQSTQNLKKAEVYVSPMDLNMEKGHIETPLKPMVRFITPVFDVSGKRRGIIALNYYGSDFLEQFDSLLANKIGRPFLLNNEGYVLHGKDIESQWRFALKNGQSFANNNLAAWEKFHQQDRGRYEQPDGVFIFSTAYPLTDALKLNKRREGLHIPAPFNENSDQYAWKIVNFIPNNSLRASYGETSFTFMMLYGALIGATAIAVRGIVSFRLRRKREDYLLRQMATHDELTGLWNRRSLFEHGEETLKHSKKRRSVFSVIMMDVDHFKKVNDTYGHAAGDMVLKELAKRLFDAVRSIDLPARYGGEEFTVLSPRTDLTGAILLADRIRTSVEAAPFDIGDRKIPITLSLGVAQFDQRKTSFKTLVDLADNALYKAKEAGRNCVKPDTHGAE